MAHLENRIAEMAKSKGCDTVDDFIERTGIGRSTAYELWNNPYRDPQKETRLLICQTFNCQPGEFLICVFDDN